MLSLAVHRDKPLRLGAHGGNRFTIVLRDVSGEAADLEVALSSLQRTGFINYFGLQRFGSSGEAATHKDAAKPRRKKGAPHDDIKQAFQGDAAVYELRPEFLAPGARALAPRLARCSSKSRSFVLSYARRV